MGLARQQLEAVLVSTEQIRKITLSGVVVAACRSADGFRAHTTIRCTHPQGSMTLAIIRTAW
jgi:hypothetical protein